MHNTEFDELAGRIEGLARAVLLIAAGLEMAGLMDGPRLADDWRGVAQRLPAGQPVLLAAQRTLNELAESLDAARRTRQARGRPS